MQIHGSGSNGQNINEKSENAPIWTVEKKSENEKVSVCFIKFTINEKKKKTNKFFFYKPGIGFGSGSIYFSSKWNEPWALLWSVSINIFYFF